MYQCFVVFNSISFLASKAATEGGILVALVSIFARWYVTMLRCYQQVVFLVVLEYRCVEDVAPYIKQLTGLLGNT